jgi:type I site-specific restriction endonuclease
MYKVHNPAIQSAGWNFMSQVREESLIPFVFSSNGDGFLFQDRTWQTSKLKLNFFAKSYRHVDKISGMERACLSPKKVVLQVDVRQGAAQLSAHRC